MGKRHCGNATPVLCNDAHTQHHHSSQDWRIQKEALQMGVQKIEEHMEQLEDETEDAEIFIEKTFESLQQAIYERQSSPFIIPYS